MHEEKKQKRKESPEVIGSTMLINALATITHGNTNFNPLALKLVAKS